MSLQSRTHLPGRSARLSQLSTQPASRLHKIAFVFCLEAFVFMMLIRTQPDVGREFGRWLPLPLPLLLSNPGTPEYNYTTALDPKLGRSAPDWRLQTLRGTPVKRSDLRGKRVALLFVGTCSSCALHRIQSWLKLPTPSPEQAWIVVTTSDLPDAQWLSQQLGSHVGVWQDIKKQTTISYNAAWVPRAYVVDEQGILRYSQASRQTLTQACPQVEHWMKPSANGEQ